MKNSLIAENMMLTVSGKQELWIENYKGIMEYTDNKIIIQGKKYAITVCGKKLQIVYYTNADMKIQGEIVNIIFS